MINTIYYKVLHEDLIHYGFQYKLGLNIDTREFNPSGSCKSGGLYYTNKEHIIDYFGFGVYIAEINIPVDAQIYKDPYSNAWKADKIIINKYYPIYEWLE